MFEYGTHTISERVSPANDMHLDQFIFDTHTQILFKETENQILCTFLAKHNANKKIHP